MENPKENALAGNVDRPITINEIARKVERGRAQSSQPHGRLGDPRRHGLFQHHHIGDHGFPGLEREAKAKEKV